MRLSLHAQKLARRYEHLTGLLKHLRAGQSLDLRCVYRLQACEHIRDHHCFPNKQRCTMVTQWSQKKGVKSLQVYHFVVESSQVASSNKPSGPYITTFMHQAVHGYVRPTIPLMSTSCAVSAACPQSDVAVHLYHIDIMHRSIIMH